MADRFPIIVDTSGIAALKELPAGDNLNLLNSGVVNAGAVDLTTITVSGSQGTDGQVLTSTGSGIAWENASAGGISDIVSDTSPQLGGTLDANSNNIDMGTNVLTDANLGNFITAHGWGNHASAGYLTSTLADTSPQLGGALDVNGQDIVTTSNGDIDLDPNGSGVVVFKGNATKGAGQFKLNCENNSHGVIIKGPAHSAAANYTLTLPTTDGNADQQLKTDGSGNLAWVDAAGGGGAWNVISSQTVSSSVAYVTFTGMTGYENYKLVWNNVVHSGQQTYIAIQVSTNGGTSWSNSAWEMFNLYFNTQSTSLNVDIHNGSEGYYYVTDVSQINQFNTSQKHAGEVMFYAFNASNYTYARSFSLADKSNEYLGVNQAFAQLRQNTGYNALRFRAGANFTGGTFTLYGLSTS
jgi:hypothetical protein